METKDLILNTSGLSQVTIEVTHFSSSLGISAATAQSRFSVTQKQNDKGKEYYQLSFQLKEGEQLVPSTAAKSSFNQFKGNSNPPILSHRKDVEDELDFAVKLNMNVARKAGAAIQIQELVIGLSGKFWYITGPGMEGKTYDKFIFDVEYAAQFCVFPFVKDGYNKHPGFNCLPGGGLAAFGTAGILRTGKNEFELQAVALEEVFNTSF